jgi:hypothetical protein
MVVNLIFNKKSAPTEPTAFPGEEQNSLPRTSPLVTEKMSLGFSTDANRTDDRTAKSVAEHKRKKSQKMPLLNYAPSVNAEELTDRVVEDNYGIEEPQFLDRYMIFSKASGEAFRLSKKLFHLFACSDNDENCKQLIVSMQEQMADPSITLAGDFPAVLAVLQNMDNE